MACPQWAKDAVFYEIYPPSFYDADGDGIGDLQGMLEKLEYIQSLGCNAIWMNACFDSPFGDGGYDIRNYKLIAPRYGTNEDMRRFIEEAHRRGIKVCFDLVAGHTSVEHEWFVQSARYEQNAYSDRYIWTQNAFVDTLDYKIVNGYSERDGNYLTNFFWFQPSLNYGFQSIKHPSWQDSYQSPAAMETRDAIIDVVKFWLAYGVDGFRCDMAMSLVKCDPAYTGTIETWQYLFDRISEEYPDIFYIAEWGEPEYAVGKAGFSADFLLHCANPAYTSLLRMEDGRNIIDRVYEGNTYFDKAGLGDIDTFIKVFLSLQQEIDGKGFIALCTGNHDLPRFSIGRDAADLEVYYAFLMTMPVIPFVYYGDEIGMKHRYHLKSKEGGYSRTGARTPMQWDDSPHHGFSQAGADSLYLPVDAAEDAPTVRRQLEDQQSLLQSVMRLISLRKAYPALAADGEFIPLYTENRGYPFVYRRKQGGQTLLVAVNPCAQEKCAVIDGAYSLEPLLIKGAGYHPAGQQTRLTLDGVSYGIWKVL